MTHVEEAIAEIDAQLVEIAPLYEGLQDYALLDLKGETRTVVQQVTAGYTTRLQWLQHAKEALQGLLNTGYPNLPVNSVDAAVMADLQDNANTIAAALTKFSADQAAALNPKGGEAESK